MTVEENRLRELAELGAEIEEEGIEVSVRSGDIVIVFAAVVAANIATYGIGVGIKALRKKISVYRDKRAERDLMRLRENT